MQRVSIGKDSGDVLALECGRFTVIIASDKAAIDEQMGSHVGELGDRHGGWVNFAAVVICSAQGGGGGILLKGRADKLADGASNARHVFDKRDDGALLTQ